LLLVCLCSTSRESVLLNVMLTVFRR
jgi:hypothetical protein